MSDVKEVTGITLCMEVVRGEVRGKGRKPSDVRRESRGRGKLLASLAFFWNRMENDLQTLDYPS